MSNIILVDAGLNGLFKELLPKSGGLPLVDGSFWGLFTSNTTITQSKVLGDFTEASYPSYARLADAASNYPAPSVTSHVSSVLRSSALSWAVPGSGSPVNVYGALLIASDGTTLLGATTFDGGPYQLSVGSAPITETPTFTLQSVF